MKWHILYIIILTSTISAFPKAHWRCGNARSSGGSSKSGGWFSGGGNSRNTYKPTHSITWHGVEPMHSNTWPSSANRWHSYENSDKPHYNHALDMPSYNYQNFNSDSSTKNDYNSFTNGYMTGTILADITEMAPLKPYDRDFDIQSETENPLEYKFITGYNGPDVKTEASSITSHSLENLKTHTNADQTIIKNVPMKDMKMENTGRTDCKTEICDILPRETTTTEPSLEITTKSFYQKLTSTTDLTNDTNCRNRETMDSIKENCERKSFETTTTTTTIKSETENPSEYPSFSMDINYSNILLSDGRTIKTKFMNGYNEPYLKTEDSDRLKITTNKIIKKDIPTTTMEPNLETTTKWYYRKFSSSTSLPKYINCRRVMNSVLNDKGEIIDSVTEVCDPPPTTTTTKPIWKITTVKPVTTSTAKPYVTVCRPVMNSFLNENGEIIDSVKEVCILEPAS